MYFSWKSAKHYELTFCFWYRLNIQLAVHSPHYSSPDVRLITRRKCLTSRGNYAVAIQARQPLVSSSCHTPATDFSRLKLDCKWLHQSCSWRNSSKDRCIQWTGPAVGWAASAVRYTSNPQVRLDCFQETFSSEETVFGLVLLNVLVNSQLNSTQPNSTEGREALPDSLGPWNLGCNLIWP